MSAEVYANGREVSAKKDSNKSMSAMPDVCLSPPSPPAGPIPIPYPNFSNASDTSDGTKRVKINGKEVGKKNSSNYKQSKGDMAATRSFGMGLVTHALEKKTYHAAWSFDVKFENENAIRHMDLTTHNHGSTPPDTLCGTISQAKNTSPPGDMNCTELSKRRRQAERKDLEQPVQQGQTHALGHLKASDGSTKIMGGVSNPGDMLKSSTTTAYAKGKPWPTVLREYTTPKGNKAQIPVPEPGPIYMACEKNKQKYHRQGVLHGESRIIEDIIASAKGTPIGKLMLAVKHWAAGKKRPDRKPCDSCEKLTCEAQACGLEIILCDGAKPKKPQCGPNGEFKGFVPA
jgi:hypothetical protein